MNLVNLKKL